MSFPERYRAGTIKRHLEISRGRHFMVVVYDLLSEPVDCIVNAANGGLSHGGGIAAQIAHAAGSALEEEGEEYLRKHGRIPTGEAVVTTAGMLPFKGVIHAVGPVFGEGDELGKLSAAVYHSLLRAHERGWSSISFPAISSGIFSVPFEICARGYVRGVIQFLQAHPDSSLKVIRLCLYHGPLVDLVSLEINSQANLFADL